MLQDTCLDIWVVWEADARIRREEYWETIEIILMFIQGKANNVPRPLPAISGLESMVISDEKHQPRLNVLTAYVYAGWYRRRDWCVLKDRRTRRP